MFSIFRLEFLVLRHCYTPKGESRYWRIRVIMESSFLFPLPIKNTSETGFIPRKENSNHVLKAPNVSYSIKTSILCRILVLIVAQFHRNILIHRNGARKWKLGKGASYGNTQLIQNDWHFSENNPLKCLIERNNQTGNPG